MAKSTPGGSARKGDNIQDDTTFLQAAISTGYDVFIPQGTYRITASLTMGTQGQAIRGCAPAYRLPSLSTMAGQKTHSCIIADGNFTAIKSGNGAAFCLTLKDMHIFTTWRFNTNTGVGVDWSTGTFNGAITGRDCIIEDVSIWYFQTGVKMGQGDPANLTPAAYAWRFRNAYAWTCQVGFRINAVSVIGHASQAHMDNCTSLQTDMQWGAGSGNVRGVWQTGGSILYSNCRFESNDWNFFLENGFAYHDGSSMEGAWVGVWNVTNKSVLESRGGYWSTANSPTPGWAMIVVRDMSPPLVNNNIGAGNISLRDFTYIDAEYFNGGPDCRRALQDRR